MLVVLCHRYEAWYTSVNEIMLLISLAACGTATRDRHQLALTGTELTVQCAYTMRSTLLPCIR
jgi:hypothetical protein